MEGQAWQAWLAHVKNKGPTWLYVALTGSHLLCCRITEVLRLKAKDFDFEHKVVAISSLKGQAAITKTMSCAAFSTFNRFKDEGISVQRVRGFGCRGRMNVRGMKQNCYNIARIACVCVWPSGSEGLQVHAPCRGKLRAAIFKRVAQILPEYLWRDFVTCREMLLPTYLWGILLPKYL